MENGKQTAFPSGDHNNVQPEYGLTKREYFAAMAMQAILSNPSIMESHRKAGTSPYEIGSKIAKDAIEGADALLKELEN